MSLNIDIKKNSESFGPEHSKVIKVFSDKLGKYDVMPFSPKDFQRMLPYSNDEYIIKCVIKSLKENTPLEHDAFGFRPFKINTGVSISYWYCIILLLYSKLDYAKEYIKELVSFYVNTKPTNLPFLHVILSNTEFKSQYIDSINKVENYFVELNKNKDYTLWANKIGIELPRHMIWDLLFVFNNQGNLVLDQLSDNKPFQISVCIEPRLIDIGFYTKSRVEVTDYGKRFEINTPHNEPSLLNLEEYILELKNNFGVTMNPKIIYKAGFGHCKNKNNIQKWLNSICI